MFSADEMKEAAIQVLGLKRVEQAMAGDTFDTIAALATETVGENVLV